MALADLIRPEMVVIPLKSESKPEIIRELVQVIKAAGKIEDVDSVFDAVMERESKCSTGLEKGLAVPHAKTTAVSTLTVSLGIAPAGVDFEALDGKPSKMFLLLLAPPDQSGPHIQALAETARLASSPTFISSVVASSSAEEVAAWFTEE